MKKLIYFDNAATSYPKPPAVIEAVMYFLAEAGGNPGRSGHRLSIESGRIVYEAREACARLFNVADSSRIVFASNTTEGLNLALFGYLKPGNHVITTSMEHNSVMRPLRYLERTRGVRVTILPCRTDGSIDMGRAAAEFEKGAHLIVVNHASNVVGTIQPLGEIAALKGSIPLLVDAAQSAGALPIDVEKDGIDMLAFPGHKSLLGPTGTGGLYIHPEITLEPLKHGGTGSFSGRDEMPEFLPDMYECGTQNAAGLAGLAAGVKFVQEEGIEKIRAREVELTRRLLKGIASIRGARLYGTACAQKQMPTLSISAEGLSSSDLTAVLDRTYGIMTRPGLHCAPHAHRTLGTYPEGTLRVSPGYFNTEEEVDFLLESLEQIVKSS